MDTKSQVSPKDFFFHLGATVALYASAVSIINLIFQIVDRALPDVLSNHLNVNSVVWPISMLIVLIPTLYTLEKLIDLDISHTLEKKDIWIRKWRIYLTLFLTGVTIVVDIIVLINTYLNGEISSRFVWKVLAVLLVSAVIFTYYLLAKSAIKHIWLRILSMTGIVLTILAIVGGFIIIGSPSKQRALRFDQQRLNDLSNIQYSVAHYWQEYSVVPNSLSDMPEFAGGLLKDPETGIAYSYGPGARSDSFEICATFAATSTDSIFGGCDTYGSCPKSLSIGINKFYDWTHGSGRQCFARTISPVDFPQVIKK